MLDENAPSYWTIDVEEAIPYSGAKSFFHCRIENSDLGYTAAEDGNTPDQAVSRAKMSIVNDMRREMSDICAEMGKLMDLRADWSTG